MNFLILDSHPFRAQNLLIRSPISVLSFWSTKLRLVGPKFKTESKKDPTLSHKYRFPFKSTPC